MIDEIYQAQWLADSRWREGQVTAKAAAALAVLAARGSPVPPSVRERIEACKDLATLDRWVTRAATAASAEDVLASRG